MVGVQSITHFFLDTYILLLLLLRYLHVHVYYTPLAKRPHNPGTWKPWLLVYLIELTTRYQLRYCYLFLNPRVTERATGSPTSGTSVWLLLSRIKMADRLCIYGFSPLYAASIAGPKMLAYRLCPGLSHVTRGLKDK